MVWAIGVVAGIGLLAGLVSLRVTFVVLASFLAVVAGAALTPAGSWPLWGIVNILAMLFALQFAYLAGYLVVCAFSRIRGEAKQEETPVSERLNASLPDSWIWFFATRC
jgi:predicted cation transporter